MVDVERIIKKYSSEYFDEINAYAGSDENITDVVDLVAADYCGSDNRDLIKWLGERDNYVYVDEYIADSGGADSIIEEIRGGQAKYYYEKIDKDLSKILNRVALQQVLDRGYAEITERQLQDLGRLVEDADTFEDIADYVDEILMR